MTRIRRLSYIAMAAALSFTAAACTSQGPSNDAQNQTETQDVVAGGEITIAATSPITDWNPISANGDTTGQRQQQWPLYPHPFLTLPDTSVVINEALLEKADVVETDPMTVEYVLQDGVQWSDGTPIGVDDFVYTQAVQDPSKCAECLAAFTEGYSDITSIEASEDGKTITMVYSEPFSEWRALFNYILPAHVAEGYGDLATSFNEGFSKNVPEFSGGPYIIQDYTDGISMTMVPNPNWYGEGPNLETITTRYITGQGEQLTALQSGEVQLVYATPTVDTMDQARQLPNMTINTGSTLTYYHLGMKTTGDVMSDPALRSAIATALDLGDMRERTIGQFAPDVPQMKSSVYVPGQQIGGQEAYRDNMTDLGIGAGDVEGAIGILEDAGYTITDEQLIQPDGTPLRDLSFLTLGTDVLRMEVAQIAQQQLLALGITINIDAADGARYSPALREGDFDLMATGTALDLGPLSMQQWYGTDAPRSFGYSNPEADALLEAAASELDPAAQIELMNELDRVLLGDGVVLPLFGTPMMAVYPNTYGNIFINPSKYGTTMNVEEWGLLAEPGTS
ncbi:peptide/nickel transport system substrate-binding protein [Stackebrandtia albiflava]|uniref:Peptide/nickel transport system substrate-binding protein n=1 Tax=Stackebrandtia albiflava TaxID=406432 RepID=A0A562UQ64_9ACTN|nr:ABC transporter family substrate-binding protein [Stackebrandtia albiflava]TWJ07750.1 peptide/nickel transport system substrate-binding protein [Stackebrandtia albiflava]